MYVESYFSPHHRYSLGVEVGSGRSYLDNGAVDYNEYYRVGTELARSFAIDSESCIAFAESCRRREHDDLLLYEPGGRRGTPI
ncbi:hypothetical protein FK535_06805 [Mycolicibacterium sp. 018/SC-01/001]|nr:hypothetical protein FK535_06805 [Mycolicibacterium sp. 018/SC-01/001]